MKKFNYLIAMAIAAFTFTSCEDVPEPFGQPINPNKEEIVIEPTGSGTEADPYNVAKVTEVTKAMADGDVKNDVYTKGYICQIDEIDITGTYGNSTYWISDDAEGKSGKYEVYRGVGLGGQKFNEAGATIIKVGDAVTIKGNIKNFKGNTPEYDQGSIIVELNGVKAGGSGSGEGGDEGGGDTPAGGTIFEESFETGQGNFTIDNKTLGEGLTYVWKHDATNKYMKASAYSGGNKDAESWLVSPEIDLSTTTKPVLNFSQVINKYFGTVADEAMVYVKKDGGEWTKVTITFPTTVPAANWSKFTDEGADQSVDLTAFKSAKTQFAFVYKSSTSAAGTWEIKNVKVSDGEGSGEGGGGETPASGPYLDEAFETSQGNFTIDNKTLGEGLTYVWKHDATNKYMKASAYSGGNKDAESWLVSPEIDLSTTTKPVLNFSQVINKYFGTVADEAMVYVKKDGGEWTKVTITFPTTVPAANWSKFTDEGADQSVDLTAFKSSKTQVAFVYKSSTSAAGTWEIKNIKVAEPTQ